METGTLITLVSGGSILVALAGGLVADPFWLALLAAALFLIPAIRALKASYGPVRAPGALGGTILQGSSAALLILALLGTLTETRLGIEPRWLSILVMWSGIAFLMGAFLFGIGIFFTRVVPRQAAMMFALSLPLGLALDSATRSIPGFFLADAGFYLGMGLFALAIIRLGTARTRTAPTSLKQTKGDRG